MTIGAEKTVQSWSSGRPFGAPTISAIKPCELFGTFLRLCETRKQASENRYVMLYITRFKPFISSACYP